MEIDIPRPAPRQPGAGAPPAGNFADMLAQINEHVGPPGAGTYDFRVKVATALKELGWQFFAVNEWWEQHRPGEFYEDKYDGLHGGPDVFPKGPWNALQNMAKFGNQPYAPKSRSAGAPPPDNPDDSPVDPDGNLRWVMTAGKTPQPKSGSTLNAVKALRELGEEEHFRYNLWKQKVEYRGSDFNDLRGIPRLSFEIEKKFGRIGYTPGKEALLSAIHACPAEYHPLQDYIKAIVWDGNLRLNQFGTYVYGLDPDDTLGNLTAALIVRGMVARIFKPGTKVSYIVVLRSDDQGVGKGESLKELAGEGNHAQGIQFGGFDFTKKIQERGRGKSIMEIAEIHSLSPEKLANAKSLATDTATNDRDAYARGNRDQPFTFVPVGTTNDRKFLSDLTGNRRHPVVDVKGPVNLQWLRENRDQLLAEAYAEFLRGDFAGPNGVALPENLWTAASADSAEYQVDDPYEDWVSAYLAEHAGAAAEQGGDGVPKIPAKKLIEDAKVAMTGAVNYAKLAEAMRRAGWDKKRVGKAKIHTWTPA